MDSPEIKLKQILKEIRLFESGPTIDGMKRLGIDYHKSFGVSLINLKKIAKKYKPDHQLAELLRTKNFRETLILSFMIEDTEKLSIPEINTLLKLIKNQELAEQFVINILEENKNFQPLAKELISSENEFEISAGFIFYARTALTDKEKEDRFFEDFFLQGIKLSEHNSISIRKSIARAFRQTALRNENLKNEILQIMKKIKAKNNKNADLVYEEVVPLIDY